MQKSCWQKYPVLQYDFLLLLSELGEGVCIGVWLTRCDICVQVAHFYNTIDQQMIPSQQAMMLDSALAFEKIVKNPKAGESATLTGFRLISKSFSLSPPSLDCNQPYTTDRLQTTLAAVTWHQNRSHQIKRSSPSRCHLDL